MKKILFAAIAAVATLAYAKTPPKLTEFNTAEEAAVLALTDAYAISHYYEVGGVIIRQANGKFTVGVPFTQYSGASVEIDYDPERYTGMIVGDYHTHPCNTNKFIPNSFSPNDLQQYRTYHTEGFLLDMCTGKIHAFKPGIDKRNPDDEDTEGRIIGRIPVDGKVTDTDKFVLRG